MRTIVLIAAASVACAFAPPAAGAHCKPNDGVGLDGFQCDVDAAGVWVVVDPACSIAHPWCAYSWSWSFVADACMALPGEMLVHVAFVAHMTDVVRVASTPTLDASCPHRAHIEAAVGCAELCLPEECLHVLAVATSGAAESLRCEAA